jgi:NADH-dependent peroxiredoxin subunit F
MLYDLIIIGAGPAGMSAGIYAARHKLKFVILTLDIGGQMNWSSEVDNYPGLPDETGISIVNKFNQHIKDYNIKINNTEVISINRAGRIFNIQTKKGVYNAKSVIIASGKKPKKLGIPGEERLLGRGVAYCATCDAPFYKNKRVVILGSGNSGLEAAILLSKYSKRVYLMDFMKRLGGEAYLKDKVVSNKKIVLLLNSNITEIFGEKFVEGIKYEKEGKIKRLYVEGVFIEAGLIAKVDFADFLKKNERGEIMICRDTKSCDENLTSVPGIFAAGDVTDVPEKQIIVAAGEGAKAALAAVDYIHRWDKTSNKSEV